VIGNRTLDLDAERRLLPGDQKMQELTVRERRSRVKAVNPHKRGAVSERKDDRKQRRPQTSQRQTGNKFQNQLSKLRSENRVLTIGDLREVSGEEYVRCQKDLERTFARRKEVRKRWPPCYGADGQ